MQAMCAIRVAPIPLGVKNYGLSLVSFPGAFPTKVFSSLPTPNHHSPRRGCHRMPRIHTSLSATSYTDESYSSRIPCAASPPEFRYGDFFPLTGGPKRRHFLSSRIPIPTHPHPPILSPSPFSLTPSPCVCRSTSGHASSWGHPFLLHGA